MVIVDGIAVIELDALLGRMTPLLRTFAMTLDAVSLHRLGQIDGNRFLRTPAHRSRCVPWLNSKRIETSTQRISCSRLFSFRRSQAWLLPPVPGSGTIMWVIFSFAGTMVRPVAHAPCRMLI
jgi:hypothetical protein